MGPGLGHQLLPESVRTGSPEGFRTCQLSPAAPSDLLALPPHPGFGSPREPCLTPAVEQRVNAGLSNTALVLPAPLGALWWDEPGPRGVRRSGLRGAVVLQHPLGAAQKAEPSLAEPDTQGVEAACCSGGAAAPGRPSALPSSLPSSSPPLPSPLLPLSLASQVSCPPLSLPQPPALARSSHLIHSDP